MSEIKLKVDEVSQTFDLEDIFGVNVSSRDDFKQKFGQAAIDIIIERTKKGKSISGRNFTDSEYDEDYVDSLAFKARGKSKRDVNMTLRGNMLNDIDIVETKGSIVKIGFQSKLETAKAFNHNTGDTPGMPTRPFFGLNGREINDLKEVFRDDIERVRDSQNSNQDEPDVNEAAKQSADDEDQTLGQILASIKGTEITSFNTAADVAVEFDGILFGDLFL